MTSRSFGTRAGAAVAGIAAAALVLAEAARASRASFRTMYAHLSRVDARMGQRLGVGTRVGLVGATDGATGPHLHFEVRLRGAAVDPLPALR